MVYSKDLRELAAGRKESHRIRFIFPQIAWVGCSEMSRQFGIASLAEARSYLRHDVLGPRLRECTELTLALPHQDIRSILGEPDALKFRSSLTLFAAAAPGEEIFEAALERFFGAKGDLLTIRMLREAGVSG